MTQTRGLKNPRTKPKVPSKPKEIRTKMKGSFWNQEPNNVGRPANTLWNKPFG